MGQQIGPQSALGGSAICCLDAADGLTGAVEGLQATGDRRMGGPRERTDDEGLVQTLGVESEMTASQKQGKAGQGRARAGQLNAHQPKRRVKRAWLNPVSASWKASWEQVPVVQKRGPKTHVSSLLLWHFQNNAHVDGPAALHPAESRRKAREGFLWCPWLLLAPEADGVARLQR
ncbi:hypothetical protein BBK36DRAFT_1189675 [Trichoderma citrinoviride]|uniref:Uncharacterized protein n=1 Tax=Trichoderma citrinoviride TaxID=58853 RepID=A0A2T4AXW3_9HYPO|nr:hypothetical protein BBK36DRAFT_1189675 [Trichoderma citrinoviride]PTB61917.1 hypothetical protein BBK36DRAFT_1189675 [Trichoderma citrinoviride]